MRKDCYKPLKLSKIAQLVRIGIYAFMLLLGKL